MTESKNKLPWKKPMLILFNQPNVKSGTLCSAAEGAISTIGGGSAGCLKTTGGGYKFFNTGDMFDPDNGCAPATGTAAQCS